MATSIFSEIQQLKQQLDQINRQIVEELNFKHFLEKQHPVNRHLMIACVHRLDQLRLRQMRTQSRIELLDF